MTAPLLAFMSLGFTEIVLVGFVALLVYGGDLPEVMRNLGRGYAKLRRSLHELTQPVRDEIDVIKNAPVPDDRSRSASRGALPEGENGDTPDAQDAAPGTPEGEEPDDEPEPDLPPPMGLPDERPQPPRRPIDLDEPPPV